MQQIVHTSQYNYYSKLFRDIEYVYKVTSERQGNPNGDLLVPYKVHISLDNLMELFAQYGYYYNLEYTQTRLPKIDITKFDRKNIIVCFSGGKDSLAAAIHYKKLGYNVYLYHVTGLNKTYTTEIQSAEVLAEKLGLPLIVEDISYKGNHEWTEHPLKNVVLATMALNCGLQHNIGYKIAVGNFYTLRDWDCVFGIDVGDSKDMWVAYEKVISTIIPKFHIYTPLQNYQTSYNIITKYDPDLLQYVQSCMTPNRFRGSFRRRTISKYGVDILPVRCGCCWKCAVEYVWLTDKGFLPVDREYYKHCIEILKNTLKKETGVSYNVNEVWQHYFFYKMPKWLGG